jgi:UDP:flavonoid glycosyltransferase YjiC (YdhE family)
MDKQKPVVLFLIYHGKSHFISCFHLARAIQHTHTVAFAGVEFFNGFVRSQGFSYYSLKTVPFGIGLEQWYNSVTNRKPVYWKTIVDRWTDRLYHLRRKELTQLMFTINPTHIVVDSLQASDFIPLYKIIASRDIRFGLLHNMLPATYSKTTLPLNSMTVPENEQQILQAYRAERLKEWKRRWKQRFKYFGLCDTDILKRRIRRNKIPKSFISDEPSLFYPVLQGIPEFVMTNPELNFNAVNLNPLRYYLGSRIDISRRDTIDATYNTLESEIQSKVSNGSRLVYCSLGTLPPTNRGEVISFLKKVIIATKALKHLLIISFQFTNDEKAEFVNENNDVYLFDSVPQLSVLKLASVFISHGGLNSIKESIEAEVPMLVCPAYATYDHNGNTARVVYHRLGLRITLHDDEDAIQKGISELINNPDFRKKLRTFKEMNARYSIKPFIDFVSNVSQT